VVDNFYTVKNANNSMLVEQFMYANQIENKYPSVYDLLTNAGISVISQLNRIDIFSCLLSLHCRTPKQFNLFFETVKDEIANEVELVKEDYKGVHLLEVLTNFIAAHEFQDIQIWTITDNSEFMTSDNPVLIVDNNGNLKNHIYREQFNMGNNIIIPLNPKQCIFFFNGKGDRTKDLFYNRIYRRNVDCSTTQKVNYLMMGSADKILFGTEKYLKAHFSLWNFS